MNITITIDELDMGGAQHVVYELVKHLDKSKYKLTVICMDGKVDSPLERQMLDEQNSGNCNIIFLKKSFFSYINTSSKLLNRIIKRLFRFPSELLILPFLCKAVGKSDPDIVHAHQHGILAGYWTLFHKIPMIATVHTDPSVTFYRECEKIIFWLLVKFNRIVLVAISEYNRELIKNYWHLDEYSARFINNGININDFRQNIHETFTFINVSRQDKNKNQSLILRAFSRLYFENTSCSLKLFLVGGGDTHEALKKEAGKLGIGKLVEFTGYVKSPKDYLALSDVYISSSRREGLSLSVLEAMAASLPVIATDAGGVRDLAQENGILIADNDEDGLLAAMRKLMNDDELRRFMGNKSLEMVQDYSAPEMAHKYGALYEEIANQ
jgi:glycosyltransferase involved in cell wall biosynthesis